MCARNANGSWAKDTEGWTEGDKWAYSFDVVQNVEQLVELKGGNASLIAFLDEHFYGGKLTPAKRRTAANVEVRRRTQRPHERAVAPHSLSLLARWRGIRRPDPRPCHRRLGLQRDRDRAVR